MHYVYVLRSKESEKFYIGSTGNIERRITEHKKGEGHTSSRMKDPELVFYEAFFDKKDSLRRERYFKTTKGRSSLRQILRESIK